MVTVVVVKAVVVTAVATEVGTTESKSESVGGEFFAPLNRPLGHSFLQIVSLGETSRLHTLILFRVLTPASPPPFLVSRFGCELLLL